MVGWPLWIAEIAALAVMPVAFVRYLTYFIPSLSFAQGVIIKILFVVIIAYVNVRGAKEAARAALEAQDVSCYITPRDVLLGEDQTESILAAIDANSVVVVCLIAAANVSKLITHQAACAFNKGIN